MAIKPTYEELENRIRELEQKKSEQKQAEDSLRENEEILRMFVKNTPAAVAMCDRQMRYMACSDRWAHDYGLDDADLIGMCHYDVFPDLPSHWKEKHKRCFSGDVIINEEEPFPRADGSMDWVRRNLHPWLSKSGQIGGLIMFTEVITERKNIEEAQRISENRYRTLTEILPIGIFETDEHGQITIANQSAFQMTGYSQSDFDKGINITDVIASQDHDKAIELHNKVVQGVSHGNGSEYMIKRKDGSTYHSYINARQASKSISQGLIGYIFDLTSLKKAEAALKESEQKFRALVEQSPLGISLIGVDGQYKYINPHFQDMFGYTLDDCPTGEDWFRIAYPDPTYRQNVKAAWSNDLQQTETGQSRPRVFSVTCKGGSLKEILFKPVTMENRDQFIVYEDITERSRMERRIQQTQKFEAIGTLAGGIAHDFNNLLMGIQGRASLISTGLELSHPHREHTRAIEDYIRSATDLTKQLLGFARGGKYEVRPIDTNELVRSSSDMFGRTKKEIRVHTSFQDPPPVIAVDRNQIEQVLLNLYINAWQAMPGSGDLYLETQIATLDEAYCQPYQVTPGHYAKISVTDTGAGMDSVTRQQIFDPFFTTKEKGRGTGLGLASAYGIIKNHNGIIVAYSEVGRGTTFNIYLPLSDQEAFREDPTEEGLIRGTETILLVDDEEMILEVAQEMLEELGYRVLATLSGEKAIEMVKQKDNGIDMVILDLIMPGMDGGHVFDSIREIMPQMPVLLSSGYAINGQADEIMQRGCNGFIQKPFNIAGLSAKIRQVRDGARNRN